MATTVCLNLYDLSTHNAIRTANVACGVIGTGAFHAAVQVYGREWSYGGCGMYQCQPQGCEEHAFTESIIMGETLLTEEEFRSLLRMLAKDWRGRDYHLLRKNCCHFSDMLCRRLGVGPIPARVMSLAGAGVAIQDGIASVASCSSDIVAGAAETTSQLLVEGKYVRGASFNDGYAVGDITRALLGRSSQALHDVLAAGKESRGAARASSYKFGDFTRGLSTRL